MAFPTTENRIVAAEAELGVRLPPEYRNRLVANNGGELTTMSDDWQVFPVFDDTDRRHLGRSANHLVKKNLEAATWNGFPSGAVAVAANGTGDLLVFLPGEHGVLSGRLHHWNHQTRECRPTPLDFT